MKNILSAIVVAALTFAIPTFAAEPPTQPAAKTAAAAQHDSVNINTADAQALTKLKGIGPKKAEAIVAWRKANGAFKTVDQLAEVKGIGAKTVEANRSLIKI